MYHTILPVTLLLDMDYIRSNRASAMKFSTFPMFPLLISTIVKLCCCDRCCLINSQRLPVYRLFKSDARSTQITLSEKKVSTVDDCKYFAASKKALAFNFRKGRYHSDCQVLQCPETNFITLVQDRKYQYYSLYPANVSTDGGSLICVPRAGIFVFSTRRLNYTDARTACRKLHGTLAHVVSEERTDGLAKFLWRHKTVYVGLSNDDDERIWKNEYDEPLSCFEYRAWDKGEPSSPRGCAGLAKSEALDSAPSWKVVPCHMSLPFICEISPMY